MQTTAPVHAAQGEEHHPNTAFYWKVGTTLFFITAFEVFLYYWFDPNAVQTKGLEVVLYALSTVKFIGVVAFFMHLYFDSKLFTAFFVTGMILAASTILAILSLLGAFGHGSVPPRDGAHAAPAAAPAAPGGATQPAAAAAGH